MVHLYNVTELTLINKFKTTEYVKKMSISLVQILPLNEIMPLLYNAKHNASIVKNITHFVGNSFSEIQLTIEFNEAYEVSTAQFISAMSTSFWNFLLSLVHIVKG